MLMKVLVAVLVWMPHTLNARHLRINTCAPCRPQNHHRGLVEQGFKTCKLLTLRQNMELVLSEVNKWAMAWGRSNGLAGMEEFFKTDLDYTESTEDFLYTAYRHLQNASIGIGAVQQFNAILDTRNTLKQFHDGHLPFLIDRLQEMMCDIAPVLKLGHFHSRRAFQHSNCFLHVTVEMSSTRDIITYTANVIVETKWKLDSIIANINHILDNIVNGQRMHY